jgi:predicted  nucleic acid-binding Zn-ribbon protein
MNVPELALHHQRLEQRAGQLRAQIERIQTELAGDPAAESLEEQLALSVATRRDVDRGLLEHEREAEDRRSRVRARERELMSGRIRNPTELMKLEQEVQHLRALQGEAEDAALELMERQEALEADRVRLSAELAAARERTAAATPGLRGRLEALEREQAEVEADRVATWERLPADWRVAYERVSSRHAVPVAQAINGQCQACRVAQTSSGMQALRRGMLVYCENCGRILVGV